MRIVSLAENTAFKDGIEYEHGLSLYIEANDKKLLFDMGQTDMFLRNAERLSIDISCVDIAVLSHGHYDHGGGLSAFLRVNKKAPVYISKYAFEPHYNGTEKYIGLDVSLKDNGRLIFTDDTFEIDDKLTLYHCNHKERSFDLGSFGLNMMVNGEFFPDDFKHEQYLLIKENEKRVLISGCSHKGILNIAEWFKADALIGGFHFSKLPLDDKLKEYAEYLNKLDTEYYTCHCTGEEQFFYMKSFMDRLHYLSAGQEIII